MLSRVADACYWMSRYIERAENNARIIAVNTQLLLDFENQRAALRQNQWEPILAVFDAKRQYSSFYSTITQESVLDFLTYDTKNPTSLFSCIAAARENARTIREQISSEMWEQINRLYLYFHSEQSRVDFQGSNYDFYRHIVEGSQLFQGITDATMTHGEAWQFIQMGKMLERADSTSRLADVKYHLLLPQGETVGGTVDLLQWKAVLRSCSAMEAYMKLFNGQVKPWSVGEFLILNDFFPRSIRFCVHRLNSSLHSISGTPGNQFVNEAERRCGLMRSNLDFTTINEVIRTGLHEFLDGIQGQLIGVSDTLTETYCRWMRKTEAS
ncbi:MAG: alpha-E domain-containing protein [Chthoniobacterales bacterium]